MKDSGIEWIGEIPESWETVRTKYIISFINGYAFDSTDLVLDYNYPVIRIGDIKEGSIDYGNCQGILENDSLDAYQVLENDILLAMSGATVGKIGMVSKTEKAYINQRVGIIRSKYSKFLYYCLSTQVFIDYILLKASGSAQPNVSGYNLGEYIICFPPLPEQHAISVHLDCQCALIDSVTEKTKASIEEYKKLRQAVITQAVTKGVRGDRPMKDSGIEWIGEIPEEWKATKIKWLLTEQKDRSESGEEEPLSMSQKYGIIPTKDMDMVPNMASSFVGAKLVGVGDLVFNKLKAHLGVFAVSQYEGLVSPDYAVYRSTGKAALRFLEYMFKTPQCIAEFRKKSTGVGAGLTRLYTDGLYSIYIPLPSLAEQKEIAEYIDAKCAEIDTLIAKKETFLTELESYKKSMIYEYVTGKKEVPSA